MGIRSINVVILLAVAVALSPLRASTFHEIDHVGHPQQQGGIQHLEHGHAHGDRVHSHGHHHHDDRQHDDSDDHHCAVHHQSGCVEFIWICPHRSKAGATPMLMAPLVADLTSASQWQLMRHANPPPRTTLAPRHLNSISTIILRL